LHYIMEAMDPQVQASFIPKKSLDMATRRGGGFGGLVFLIALLIFVASLVAAGSVFAYTKYLNNAIVSKSASLTAAEGAYDPGTIQDLVRIDNRLTQANILLHKHIASSGVFAFLSNQTLPNVSFGTFDYELGTDGSAKISMVGVADNFSTVALQSDQFDGNKLLKNVDFSNITSDPQTGQVRFSVSATVDPSVLSYVSLLGAGAAPATDSSAAQTAPATTTTTASTTPAH
jgi:hypothetical protein